jgi:hypothetical protein|nr:MAG: hypothetical protein KatS3mg041_1651 [Bacteroidota bacterium]
MARRIRKGGRDGQAPQHFTFPYQGQGHRRSIVKAA